jgi:hypothetical protein
MEILGETIEGVKQVVAEAKRACSKALIPLPEEVSPCKGGAAHLRPIGRGGGFGHQREPSAVLPSRN